jgi:hypothetical protein
MTIYAVHCKQTDTVLFEGSELDCLNWIEDTGYTTDEVYVAPWRTYELL